MRISVFGLGYVGCVSTGCLAQNGHHVIGVDVNQDKVNLINSGKPTIVEKDIDNIIKQGYNEGKIAATTDFGDAILKSDISFICVGTPSLSTGHLDLEYVFNTAWQIGEALKAKNSFHIIVIRSTVFPGTNEKVSSIISEISGKKPNDDYEVVSNPEFLREGSAVEDYYHPSVTVIGSDSEKAITILEEIYKNIDAPIIRTDIRVAEMIKYVNNTFHALKIVFANEVSNICKSLNIDPFKVMDLFKMDTRLNISPAYFNPGMAYGGSCLPKDLKGLGTIAHDNYINTPVITAIEKSNEIQKQRVFNIIQNSGLRRVGILGLAFKKGTDDLRYSPSVTLVESLLGKGYEVLAYDKNVKLSWLTGTNRIYVAVHMPHISAILKDSFEELINNSEIMVIAHRPDPEELTILKSFKGKIFDLVRLPGEDISRDNVEGISW